MSYLVDNASQPLRTGVDCIENRELRHQRRQLKGYKQWLDENKGAASSARPLERALFNK